MNTDEFDAITNIPLYEPPHVVEPVPAEITKAICQVMLSMTEAIPKRGRNDFAKFNFVSVDDIYAKISRHMAQAGLVVLTLEESAAEDRIQSGGKTGLFITFKFKFVLAAEGKTWTDKSFVRSVRAQCTGPQSFAAAQSFAEKSFLRSLFKLATGDSELDQERQADTLEDQVGGAAPVNKRKSSAAAKRDGDDKEFNTLKHRIEACNCPNELTDIYNKHVIDGQAFGAYPHGWAALLDDEYALRMQDITTAGAR